MLDCAPGTWTKSGADDYRWTLDGQPVAVGTDPGQTGSTNAKRFRASAEYAGTWAPDEHRGYVDQLGIRCERMTIGACASRVVYGAEV